MRKLSTDELKYWYFNAVKSDLVLNYYLLPEEADKVIEEYGLKELLDNYTDIQLHDDPRTVSEDIREQGLIAIY